VPSVLQLGSLLLVLPGRADAGLLAGSNLLDCTFEVCSIAACCYHQDCLERYLKSIRCERCAARPAQEALQQPRREPLRRSWCSASRSCRRSPKAASSQQPQDRLQVPARVRQGDELWRAVSGQREQEPPDSPARRGDKAAQEGCAPAAAAGQAPDQGRQGGRGGEDCCCCGACCCIS